MNSFAARRVSADSHGAERKALLLGQLYVGLNSLRAPFVTVIVQLTCCLVLCSGFAGMQLKKKWVGLPHQDAHAKIATVCVRESLCVCSVLYLTLGGRLRWKAARMERQQWWKLRMS